VKIAKVKNESAKSTIILLDIDAISNFRLKQSGERKDRVLNTKEEEAKAIGKTLQNCNVRKSHKTPDVQQP